MVMKALFCPKFVMALALACGLVTSNLNAAKRADEADKSKDEGRVVELFSAMDSGEVEVELIPKDSTRCTVIIKNKAKEPLRIKLPEAFAGVPVLGQAAGGMMGGGGMGGMGGFGGGGMGGGGMGGMGGGQGLGGGMGGGGMGGMGGMGGGGLMGGGGFFNVAPDKDRKLKLTTVCLEHGKPEPRPQLKYKLVPLESFTKTPEVIALCKALGSGKLDQKSAQAATWHYTDNMTWEQLAQKIGVKHLNGSVEPFFTLPQIRLGMNYAAEAAREAQLMKERDEKSDSLSQR
jgi:hypothetical protein